MGKRILKAILFPFVFAWLCVAYAIYKTGKGLANLGNRMSGYRLDKSIGTIEINQP